MLAQPGGFIFPFLELGSQMTDLLKRLIKGNVAVDYTEQILAAFRAYGGAASPEAAGHPDEIAHQPLRESTFSQPLISRPELSTGTSPG